MDEGQKEILRQMKELLKEGVHSIRDEIRLAMGWTGPSPRTPTGIDIGNDASPSVANDGVVDVLAPGCCSTDTNLLVASEVADIAAPTLARRSTEGPSSDSIEMGSASAPATVPMTPTATVDIGSVLEAVAPSGGTLDHEDASGMDSPPAKCSMVSLSGQPVAAPVFVASSPTTPTEYVLNTNNVLVVEMPLATTGEYSADLVPTIQLQQTYDDCELFRSSSSLQSMSKVPLHRPMPWPSFMSVHADGDESRPQPWPAFKGITDWESSSGAIMKPYQRRTSDCFPMSVGDIVKFQIMYYYGNLCTSTGCITIHDMCSPDELIHWNEVLLLIGYGSACLPSVSTVHTALCWPSCHIFDFKSQTSQLVAVKNSQGMQHVSSFPGVHVDGDQTRPLPWPSFKEASIILQVAVSLEDGNVAAYMNVHAVCVELVETNGPPDYTTADSCEYIVQQLVRADFSRMANAQAVLSQFHMGRSFHQRQYCKQRSYHAVESNPFDALCWGGEHHAREQLFSKKLCVVAFIPGLLHEKGLARYICSTCVTASLMHILIETSFHMHAPYVHWHEDGESWGSDELIQWLNSNLLGNCFLSKIYGSAISSINTLYPTSKAGFQVAMASILHEAMLELQLTSCGNSCVCLHELQQAPSGTEGTALLRVYINMHSDRLKCDAANLAHPGYFRSFSSASEVSVLEGEKLELKNRVSYMVVQYTDKRSIGIKTGFHSSGGAVHAPFQGRRHAIAATIFFEQVSCSHMYYLDSNNIGNHRLQWDPGRFRVMSAWGQVTSHYPVTSIIRSIDSNYLISNGLKVLNIPWDPGTSELNSSSRSRLGDKPYFKEGGVSGSLMGLGWHRYTQQGLGPLIWKQQVRNYIYAGADTKRTSSWIRTEPKNSRPRPLLLLLIPLL